MSAPRPVDLLPVPAEFAMSRQRALGLCCCARCGHDVRPQNLTPRDLAEYHISALCPRCATELFALWPEEEGDSE